MPRREWLALSAFVLFWRICQLSVLWIEEAYPMAGAIELLSGRLPYWDFWFDKPPGAIFFYLLSGALPGLPLRLAGTAYVLLCCWLASRLGGRWAAWLLAAYLSWGIPSAVFALAPDLLLVAPHLAAVYLAQQGRPLLAGLCSGLAFWIHTKGLLVLAAALLWSPHWRLLLAFALTLPVHALGGLPYWQQVWEWGRTYSSHTFLTQPLSEFGRRTLNWMGFQSAALLAIQLRASQWNWRWWAWCALGFLSLSLGLRFFPRYYFFLLVPVVVMAGQALAQLRPRLRWLILALLLIPALRFAPHNLRLLVGDDSWSDLALFRDSRHLARTITQQAQPGDTLFVWGYRPDISVLARMSSGTPFLESQPLDCIFADRHLTPSRPMPGLGCEERLARFRLSRPRWMVDGLGPLNPQLRLERFHSLEAYEVVERTNTAVLYRLNRQGLPVEARQASPAAAALPWAAIHPVAR